MGKVKEPTSNSKNNGLASSMQHLIELLVEYTAKLDAIVADYFHGQSSRREIIDSAPPNHNKALLMALMDLSGFASGRIEYAVMDDLTRLELKLRLYEFEARLLQFKKIVGAPPRVNA